MNGFVVVTAREHRELVAYRKATGGLPPALVAKGLAIAADARYIELHFDSGLDDNEIAALRAATFEVTT